MFGEYVSQTSTLGGSVSVEINSMREKTVAVLFSRKQKPPERFLTFEGKTLEYADSVRYLGVELGFS